MIRVFLSFNEPIPRPLKNSLEQIKDFEPHSDVQSADVILHYTAKWNRAAYARISSGLRGSPPLIVFCETAEQPFTRDSIIRGEVSAVLSSQSSTQQIGAAVPAAIAGLQVYQRWQETVPVDPHPVLTPREMEILRLLADGEGNKTIADILNISPHTVKFHISSIFEKLNVLNRTEAVRAGIMRGLLSI